MVKLSRKSIFRETLLQYQQQLFVAEISGSKEFKEKNRSFNMFRLLKIVNRFEETGWLEDHPRRSRTDFVEIEIQE